MKNMTYIFDEIGLASQQVQSLCTSINAAIISGNTRMAKENIAELIRVVRQATVMTNVVRDVMDAMETGQVAQGDLEAAKQVYQEA
jgi:hypothetical protein